MRRYCDKKPAKLALLDCGVIDMFAIMRDLHVNTEACIALNLRFNKTKL